MIVEVANTCDFITTSSECEAAARYLGLSDISAYASYNQGSLDPPYCYFEGGNLQFNSDETNTGKCGGGSGQFHDKCLCKSSGEPRNVFGIYLAMDEVSTFSISYNRICYRFRVVYADI